MNMLIQIALLVVYTVLWLHVIWQRLDRIIPDKAIANNPHYFSKSKPSTCVNGSYMILNGFAKLKIKSSWAIVSDTSWVHLKYVKARFLYILPQCRDAIYRVSTNMRCTLPAFSINETFVISISTYYGSDGSMLLRNHSYYISDRLIRVDANTLFCGRSGLTFEWKEKGFG